MCIYVPTKKIYEITEVIISKYFFKSKVQIIGNACPTTTNRISPFRQMIGIINYPIKAPEVRSSVMLYILYPSRINTIIP